MKSHNWEHMTFWLGVGILLLAAGLLGGLTAIAPAVGIAIARPVAELVTLVVAMAGATVVTAVTTYCSASVSAAIWPRASFWERARAAGVPVAIFVFPLMFVMLVGAA